MSDSERQATENTQTTQPVQPAGPSRALSQQIGIYYSNCAPGALSARDISLFFGRYVPTSNDQGSRALGERHERQIYMTIEQAEDLVQMLTQSIQTFKARKSAAERENKAD
jgi:hypothetical protein